MKQETPHMEPTDALLLERWRDRGEPDAFSELVRRYWPVAFQSSRRMLGNAGEAEEVAQECFIELMQTRRRVRYSLGGWLHRVSVRRSLDRIRAESRRRARERDFAGGRASADARDPADDEIAARVDEAVEHLPAAARSILVAHYFEGKPYAEIARTLGISESAARYRVNVALDKVRRRLKRMGITCGAAAVVAAMDTPAGAVPAPAFARLAKLAVAGPPPAGLLAGPGGAVLKAWGAVAVLAAAGFLFSIVARTDTFRPVLLEAQESTAAVVAEGAAPAPAVADEPPAPPDPVWAVEPPKPSAGRIRARVVNDRGEPVPGVSVLIARIGRESVRSHGAILPQFLNQKVFTGPDGIVQFDELPLPEFGDMYNVEGGATYVLLASARDRTAAGTAFIYTDRPEHDLELTLQPAQVLAGRVHGPDAEPIAGARVLPLSGRLPRAEELTRSTATNNAGEFTVPHLPRAQWRLLVTAPGYAPSFMEPLPAEDQVLEIALDHGGTVAGTLTDGGGAALPGVAVTLSLSPYAFYGYENIITDAEGRFQFDNVSSQFPLSLRLEDEGWHAAANSPRVSVALGETATIPVTALAAASISGRVYDLDTGAGVPDVEVQCRTTTRTDAGGRYTFAGLYPGECEIGLGDLDGGYRRATEKETGGERDRVRWRRDVMLKPGEQLTGVDFAITRGACLNGLVTTTEGVPISGANIVVTLPSLAHNERTAETGSDGRFTVDGLHNDIVVAVKAAGFGRYVNDALSVPRNEDLRVVLEPEAVLAGTLKLDEGRPVVGCVLEAIPSGCDVDLRLISVTDLYGGFRLQGLFAGEYTIRTRATSERHESIDLAQVQLKPGQEVGLALNLPPSTRVAGYVKLAGRPCPGATVSCGEMGNHKSVTADADGYYVLQDMSTRGYRIYAGIKTSAEGSRSKTLGITPRQGELNRLDFDFESDGATIEGAVTVGGQPAQRVSIIAQWKDADGNPEHYSESPTDTGFRLENLPQADFDLRICLNGNEGPSTSSWNYTQKMTVTTAAGRVTSLPLDFAGTPVVCRIINPNNQPLLKAAILEGRAELPTGRTFSDLYPLIEEPIIRVEATAPEFELPPLAKGAYTLVVYRGPESSANQDTRAAAVVFSVTGDPTPAEVSIEVR